jgi:hypothetical protein
MRKWYGNKISGTKFSDNVLSRPDLVQKCILRDFRRFFREKFAEFVTEDKECNKALYTENIKAFI